MSRETLVILNPASRGGSTGRRWPGIARRIEATLGSVRIERTEAAGDARRLAREACDRGVERIVVAGGDGTVGEVASGLLDREPGARPILGLLPLGSGCDLARSLGLPRRVGAALEVVAAGATRRIDAARLEYRDASGARCHGWFVNEVSAGLSGVTTQIVGRISKRVGPRIGFAAGAIAAIFSHRPVAMRIEADGKPIHEGPVSLIVASNGRHFGAGMAVAPKAELDDGWLEIVVVRGLSVPRLLVNLPSLFRGTHLDHPAVSRHAARELVVMPASGSFAPGCETGTAAAVGAGSESENSPIEADGEPLGGLPFRAEIVPAALRVFAPAASVRQPDAGAAARTEAPA